MKLAAIGILFLFAYFPTLVWMADRWMAADSYYGHGFLIPLVSAYLVWRKRKEIAQLPKESSSWGLVLLVVGLLIHLASAMVKVYFTSGFSILISVSGLVLYLGGKRLLRAVGFPIFMLFFMIPFPLVVIGTAVLRLKLFAAMCATVILHLIGMPAVQQGSTIFMRNATVLVDDPCSGLRSLLSLLTLGVLFAYLKQARLSRRVLFFLSSIPIAIFANVIRIVMLAGIADIYGVDVALKFFHDFSGFVVFGLALGGLSLVGRVLQ